MPKRNKCYERRHQRFHERLQETGSQSNQELKEFEQRRNARRRKPSRINRHQRSEREFWKRAREHVKVKEAKREAQL